MKPTNSTLNSILGGRVFFTADLYQITLTSATATYYFCSGQQDIVFAGNTYLCGGATGPYFDRKDNKAKVSWRLGPGSDRLVVDVLPGSATVLNGIGFLAAVRAGIFDGADFKLSRAFMLQYGVVQSGCAVLMFQGRIAEVDADRSIATFTVNDYRELLNQQLPRNLFGPGCVNTLGDASCTVNLATFASTTAVQAGTTPTNVMATTTHPSGYFQGGKMTFTSGILQGLSFSLSDHLSGSPDQLVPVAPLPFLPAVGDTFVAYPGCDRSRTATGCTKFANIGNYRGFPYVPTPEMAL